MGASNDLLYVDTYLLEYFSDMYIPVCILLLLLCPCTTTVRDWYEPGAMLLCDEGTVICGLLVGLNAIDYNVMLSGEEFDQTLGVLDLSQYLKDGNYLGKAASGEESSEYAF